VIAWLKGIAWRLLFAALLVGTGIAAANNYLATVPGTGTTFGSVVISTVNYAAMLICDATVGETNCAAVDSTGTLKMAGFDSGPVTATATPNGSSHAAGSSVGGLFTLAVARTNGGSGQISGVIFNSLGGSTGQYVLRIWQKNPVNTTCTDQTAFVSSNVDDAFLITGPQTITALAPAVTTGDSKTYAVLTGLNWDYKNADTSPGQNLYACVITVLTDTADESNLVRLTLAGPQN